MKERQRVAVEVVTDDVNELGMVVLVELAVHAPPVTPELDQPSIQKLNMPWPTPMQSSE